MVTFLGGEDNAVALSTLMEFVLDANMLRRAVALRCDRVHGKANNLRVEVVAMALLLAWTY